MRRLFRQSVSAISKMFIPVTLGVLNRWKFRCEAYYNPYQEIEATMSKIFFSPDQSEYTDLKIFSFGGEVLAREIVAHLDISEGRHETIRFYDGEINMNLLDSVSGHKVFIIKTFDNQKINDGIMELILAISCMKKAGASSVVAIIPYFPYSRVDATSSYVSTINTFFAADIAKLIESCGCDMIITINGQLKDMKGFTNKCSFISVDCTYLIVPYLVHKEIEQPILVGASLNPFYSMHIRALKETFQYFDQDCDLGFFYSDTGYVGTTIKDRDVILFENIIRTGQKLRSRIRDLQEKGARNIYCFSAHCLLSAPEIDLFVKETGIKYLILTNSVYRPNTTKHVRYISVAKFLAENLCLIHRDTSLNSFRNERGILKMAFVEKIRRFSAIRQGYNNLQASSR